MSRTMGSGLDFRTTQQEWHILPHVWLVTVYSHTREAGTHVQSMAVDVISSELFTVTSASSIFNDCCDWPLKYHISTPISGSAIRAFLSFPSDDRNKSKDPQGAH
jgi:hypothetical protein